MSDSFALDESPVALSEVQGFRTGAASCSVRPSGPDTAVLFCEDTEGVGTAILTGNSIRAAPVLVSSPRAASGRLRAAVVSAGNANSCTGKEGRQAAREMIAVAAEGLGLAQEQLLCASCGPAGPVPETDHMRAAVADACREARDASKGDFAGAISSSGGTKSASASGSMDGKPFRIAGVLRAPGGREPDMAALFAFIVTDVAIEPDCLREVLVGAAERTFDGLVGGGPGTNDTVCLLTSGRAGNDLIDNVFSVGVFAEALEAVARELVAAPGPEECQGPVEIRVTGAMSEAGAVQATRAIAAGLRATPPKDPDSLVGVVLAAAGRAEARIDDSRATVRLGEETLFDRGERARSSANRDGPDPLCGPARVEVDLGAGSSSATAWAVRAPGAGTQRAEAAEREAREVKALLEDAERKHVGAEEARSAAERELETMGASLREASAELEDVRARATEAEVKAADGLRALHEKLKEAEAGRSSASEEAQELRERVAQAAERATQAEGALDGLEAKLGDAEAARLALLREADGLRKHAAASEKVAVNNAESELREAKAQARAEKRELESRLKQAQAAHSSAEKQVTELQRELAATAKAAEVGASEEVASLKGELVERDRRIEESERRVADADKASAEGDELRRATEAARAQAEAARQEADQAKVKFSLQVQLVKQLLGEEKEYKARITALEARITASEAEARGAGSAGQVAELEASEMGRS